MMMIDDEEAGGQLKKLRKEMQNIIFLNNQTYMYKSLRDTCTWQPFNFCMRWRYFYTVYTAGCISLHFHGYAWFFDK